MALDLDNRLVQDIQKIGQKYHIKRILLFGSRARGDYKLTSDIDLAIFPLPEFNSKGRVSNEIDDLATLLKLDTVFVDQHIDPKLMENIAREGVTLYERSGN